MAIVFISSKKKQRMVLGVLAAALLAVCVIVPIVIFSSWFSVLGQKPGSTISLSNTAIDFSVIDSVEVKRLEISSGTEREFSYRAKDAKGKLVSGKISGPDKATVSLLLKSMGLDVLQIEELLITVGRSEPFVPYK